MKTIHLFFFVFSFFIHHFVWGQNVAFKETEVGGLAYKAYDEYKLTYYFKVVDAEFATPIDAQVEIKTKGSKQPLPGYPKSILTGYLALPEVEKEEYSIKIFSKGYEDSIFVMDKPTLLNLEFSSGVISLRALKKEIEISIKDIATDENILVKVTLINKTRNERIELDAKEMKNGKYRVQVRTEDDYELEINNTKGYLFYAAPISIKKAELEVRLTTFEVGSKIKLNNITFQSNSSELDKNAILELGRVIELMQVHPTAKIEIAAHTDDLGTAEQNMVLSQQRAKVVFDYLISNNLQPERFVCKAYGSADPIVPNNSEENRAKNRRFELVVLDL